MMRDSSHCNSYNYGDSLYWDARYSEEVGSAFDWYQRYSALRPFLQKFVPTSSRVLMVGCGNSLISEDTVNDGYVNIVNIDISSVVIEIMKRKCAHITQLEFISEDMVNDGYVNIVNIDISSVVIEIMKRKCAHITQLEYMQMDVRDMSFFQDESFNCVIDKGTLDSLMCGTDAPLSAFQMLEEVSRILEPEGIYMLITYGDPSVRVPHLNKAGCKWKIMLYIIPRPGFQARDESSSSNSITEPVPLTDKGLLPPDFVLEDPDSHYIYVCKKINETLEGEPDHI